MSPAGPLPATADAVVVGGGTIGGWCAWFLRRAGLARVVLLERDRLGQGASSRAAGVVRGQGGTPAAVRLGVWTRAFYQAQAAELPLDSGFREQGYYLPAFTPAQVEQARARMAMQRACGLDVEWLDAAEGERRNPTLAPGATLGGTFAAADGYLDPPRNVLAYATALTVAGVHVHEQSEFTGLRLRADRAVSHVQTSRGLIATPLVVLTGGPTLDQVGRAAGIRVPSGAVRHQVAVTAAHPDLDPARLPMVFDVASGIYWRPEDGGLLFGMSNPDELPGPATGVDWPYLERIRARLAALVPVTAGLELRKVWAATIDYTPDHLPIIGPAQNGDGVLGGVHVAAAGGHGMMWGPAVSRAVADVALTGSTDVVDVTDLGLDRFDADGVSRLAPDPIALPFPETLTSEAS